MVRKEYNERSSPFNSPDHLKRKKSQELMEKHRNDIHFWVKKSVDTNFPQLIHISIKLKVWVQEINIYIK